ncbi:hypothetical protein [Bradyrhizobium manausense]|uniref:Uncharacterized protein n=1 Tax=Bradyrhizobium manausense TaxID=989370 RepID=A0A0R3DJJ2_9BRAD|nr:hypothetical protein [Bradyrhizobium manausense]KRQ07509.1 hypothetical protein AOQ71_23335 [Bradyrhizobium manausense]
MNALVPQNFGPVSTRFQGVAVTDDLSAGVQAGFGIMGYKGKVWSLRKGGQETPLMRPDGDGPRNSIEVVILKASAHVSKIWYENGYVEGSTAAPDCFSSNGVTPDPASKKRQHNACATCPMNQWGSRITPAGKQGKACSDSKRLAIAPAEDIKNEAFGGPLLLRVPAASLRDLAAYGEKMSALGYQYFAIATRIAFDPGEAYPKFVFGAIRPLTDAEADLVLEMRDSRQVTTILAEGSEMAAPAPVQQAAATASAFERPPIQPVAAPANVQQQVQKFVQKATQPQPLAQQQPQPVVAPQPAFGGAEPKPGVQTVQQVQSQVTATPEAGSDFEANLDAELDKLLLG